MKIKVIVRETEEGASGPRCQRSPAVRLKGETFEELLQHLYEAIEACLAGDVQAVTKEGGGRVLEIAV